MHNIVYYQSNMTCLTVLIMNIHIHKYPIFYISFKISKQYLLIQIDVLGLDVYKCSTHIKCRLSGM